MNRTIAKLLSVCLLFATAVFGETSGNQKDILRQKFSKNSKTPFGAVGFRFKEATASFKEITVF